MAVKRTIRKSFFTAKVNRTAGEHLHFRITAAGSTATFVFSSKDRDLFRASEFPGHPKTTYERRWPKRGDVVDAKTAVYSLTFGFLGATEYSLLVEIRSKGGTPLKVIKDIDYEREDQMDVFAELFKITLT